MLLEAKEFFTLLLFHLVFLLLGASEIHHDFVPATLSTRDGNGLDLDRILLIPDPDPFLLLRSRSVPDPSDLKI
ncbi:hypothetical protein OROMI_011807 [Orobanche minor]